MRTGSIVAAVTLALLAANSYRAGAQQAEPAELALGSGYGVAGAALARAEEAICRSVVNYGHVRGAFGETVMERVALGSRRGGGWQTVSVSPKPQGIDGIYIRRGVSGQPSGLLLGEAKFGTAQLGITRDGRQMSSAWTPPRLAYEAARYTSAGNSAMPTARARPRGLIDNPDVVRVRLPDGRDGYFWRGSQLETWAYDGPQGTFKAAQAAALRDGRYLQAAADGKITYRQRVFKVDVSRDVISVKMQDAKPTVAGGIEIKEIARIKIDAATRLSYMSGVKAEIARQMMVKHPHLSEKEARAIAASATGKMRNLEAIVKQRRQPYWVSAVADVGKAGLAGGVFAGALDVAVQMHSKGQVDWGQAGGMTIIGATSGAAGAAAHYLVVGAAVKHAVANQFFVHTANALGLPTGMAAASVIGQGAGGAVGSVVFAAMMSFSGQMEGGDAARLAAAGTTGSLAGAAAGSGLIVLATMYGTAGTGAAISSLGGAAAQSAALAWLGGGSLAAGGGGMALGTVVVSGGIAIVAVATTAVIYWGYAMYDDNVVNLRHEYMATGLMNDTGTLQELCRRRWLPGVR